MPRISGECGWDSASYRWRQDARPSQRTRMIPNPQCGKLESYLMLLYGLVLAMLSVSAGSSWRELISRGRRRCQRWRWSALGHRGMARQCLFLATSEHIITITTVRCDMLCMCAFVCSKHAAVRSILIRLRLETAAVCSQATRFLSSDQTPCREIIISHTL